MFPPRWSLRRARILVGTKFLLVWGLVGFVVLAWLIETAAGLSDSVSLGRLPALIMASVPALLWLAFFYLQDRHEPEPRAYVLGIFALGALVAAPLANFVIYQASPPVPLGQHGVRAFSLDRMVHAILVVGLAQELCKYVVVRYSVYMSREFDEPMDGVVYMMAVGTGFAVWSNYHYLSDRGHEVYLSTGAAHAVVGTLAHASFAGALGYVMGRARFSRRSAWARGILLALGLLGAALLNGQFALVEQYLLTSRIAGQPWKVLGYAALMATVVFGGLMLLTQRLLADSPFRPDEDAAGDSSG